MIADAPGDSIRAFIALEFPAAVRDALAELQRRLRPGAPDARWVSPENLHLTLRFLGDTPGATIDAVRHAMTGIVARHPVFRLGLQGAGAFPNIRRARVVWAGVTGDTPAVRALADELERAMRDLGLPAEKSFRPHVTLARLAPRGATLGIERVVASLKDAPIAAWEADSVALLRSEITRRGPVYSPLSRILLPIPGRNPGGPA